MRAPVLFVLLACRMLSQAPLGMAAEADAPPVIEYLACTTVEVRPNDTDPLLLANRFDPLFVAAQLTTIGGPDLLRQVVQENPQFAASLQPGAALSEDEAGAALKA